MEYLVELQQLNTIDFCCYNLFIFCSHYMTECEKHYIGLINNLDGGNQGTP